MKDLVKNGVIVLLVIGVLYIIFLRECKSPEPCPAADEMIIKQSAWDSILAVANKPPVVIRDTIWKTKPTVTPNPQPPIPEPEEFNFEDLFVYEYRDTLKNEEIDVWVNYVIDGELLSREWHYNPIVTEISVDSLIYVPYPVEIEKPITKAKNGLYLSGIAGGNKSAFLFGGGLDLITKKETMIGYQYQRFGNENFHSVRFGIKFGK